METKEAVAPGKAAPVAHDARDLELLRELIVHAGLLATGAGGLIAAAYFADAMRRNAVTSGLALIAAALAFGFLALARRPR